LARRRNTTIASVDRRQVLAYRTSVQGLGRDARGPDDLNVFDLGVQDGFKWSLQHLEMRSCDGQTARVDSEGDGALADVVAGAAAGRAA
jgi:hypothetical protein